jgi:pimeloyl-ACP methyl ester carboxylesterase
MKLRFIVSVFAALAICGLAAHSQTIFTDTSPHKTQFIQVDDGVQLEVLDWGGAGRPIVLLAGYLTAHVYDEIAPKLLDLGHIYGITRRGLGASSKPTGGYAAEKSAEDVLHVLDRLALQRPILVGHSFGGQDLTFLGATQPERMSALVYLDSAEDTTLEPVGSMDTEKLPEALRVQHPANMSSFSAYREWQRNGLGFAFPESELRQIFAANPDGSVGRYLVSKQVRDAMFEGLHHAGYSRIRVPVLAFFDLPLPIEDQVKLYKPQTIEEGVTLGVKYGLDLARFARQKDALKRGVPDARIVELAGANTYIFLSNETDVIRELRMFVTELPR